MRGYAGRVLIVATLAALLAAPTQLGTVQGAERTLGGTAARLTSPAPTATDAEEATPEPTAKPTPKPTVKATPKIEATRKPEPTKAPTKDQVWATVVYACLATTNDEGEACFRALSKSGMSLADLRAGVSARLEELTRQQAARGELEVLLRKCIESQGLESDACMRAWKLSGLSLEDFRAIVLKKLQTTTKQGER